MNILVNSENRLRSGWRILIQFVLFILLLMLVQAIERTARGQQNAFLYGFAEVLYLLGGIGLIWAAGRWLDRREVVDFGFHLDRRWWLDMGAGFLLGAVMVAAIVAIERMAGWAEIVSITKSAFEQPFILTAVVIFLKYVSVGFGEEMVFRGYQIRNLAEGLPVEKNRRSAVAAAWIGTSLLFGLLHLMNPNASSIAALNISLAGLLLGLGYVLTGQLGLPIGLHIATNFFQSFVFGLTTSGAAPSSYWISIRVSGPELWTGGSFGPEAGLVATGVTLLGALLILIWVRYTGRWKGIRPELAEYRDRNDHLIELASAAG